MPLFHTSRVKLVADVIFALAKLHFISKAGDQHTKYKMS